MSCVLGVVLFVRGLFLLPIALLAKCTGSILRFAICPYMGVKYIIAVVHTVYSVIHSRSTGKQLKPPPCLGREGARTSGLEITTTTLSTQRQLHIYPMCELFTSPGIDAKQKERNGCPGIVQSGMNEIAEASKRLQMDSNPSPLNTIDSPRL